MLKAVFFDLDGTLLDTVPEICHTLNETLIKYGYPPLSEAQTAQYVGNGAQKLVERATPKGAPMSEVLMDFRARYATCANEHTRMYEGALECLAKLKERGLKLAVITNKPQEATVGVIEKFFPNTFDFVGGDSGMFPCKPDPSLARYAALTLRVAPSECLFVGDGETDVVTAQNAHMRCIAALWGYRSREVLAAAGATEFAESFAELTKITEKIS